MFSFKTSQVSIPESIWSDSQLAAYEPQLNTLDEFLPSVSIVICPYRAPFKVCTYIHTLFCAERR